MDAREEAILDMLQFPGVRNLCLKSLQEKNFGKSSQDFLNDQRWEEYFRGTKYIQDQAYSLQLWLLIEKYITASIVAEVDEQKTKALIEEIEKRLQKAMSSPSALTATTVDKLIAPQEAGTYSLTDEFFNQKLICNVYATNNEALITLFAKYLPQPAGCLFKRLGMAIPQYISDKEQRIITSIQTLLIRCKAYTRSSENTNTLLALEEMEKHTVTIQRQCRAKLRQQEELVRISWLFAKYLAETNKTAASVLQEVNIPYLPKKCNRDLAYKIVHAAAKLKFPHAKTITSAKTLVSVFDDGLLSQHSMKKSYHYFSSATLTGTDIINGDNNAICCGLSGSIDPGAYKDEAVEIVFDLNKLTFSPNIFYKQRDFGFVRNEYRIIKIGDYSLQFTHTHETTPYHYMQMILEESSMEHEKTKQQGRAVLPNCFFIAYDFGCMAQILTLNFFRLLDALDNEDFIKRIYEVIEVVDEKTLFAFLQDLSMKITDTAEFNFYESYKIDLSTILSINKLKPYSNNIKYSLDMQEFINKLATEDGAPALQVANSYLPTLFKSCSFIDYLLAQNIHTRSKHMLLAHRKKLVPSETISTQLRASLRP